MSDTTINMTQNANGEWSVKPPLASTVWKTLLSPALRGSAKVAKKLFTRKNAVNACHAFFTAAFIASPFATISAGAYHDFQFDDYGNKRGTLAFVFQKAHDNASAQHDAFYQAVMENAPKQGIAPLVPLLIMAKETGLNVFGGDSKSAQGPYQMKSLFYIEALQNYAQKTDFYQNLPEGSFDKMAIDSILKDKTLKNPDKRVARAAQLDKDFREGSLNPDSFDTELLSLRNNFAFTTQLISAKLYKDYPGIRLENLPKDADAALEVIAGVMGEIYAGHMMGPTGRDYLFTMAQTHPDVIISDVVALQTAANKTQADQKFIYGFDATPWGVRADKNKGIFKDGTDTKLGDIPAYFQAYSQEQASIVYKELDTIQFVSSQSFYDFLITGINVAETYHNSDTTMTSSPFPPQNPAMRSSPIPKPNPKRQTPS